MALDFTGIWNTTHDLAPEPYFEFDPNKAKLNLKNHRVSFQEAITVPSVNTMKKAEVDPLVPRKLDWSKAVRGKYNNLLAEGTNVAVIDPELLPHFPDSDSVTRALRAVLMLRESVNASRPPRARKRAA